MISKLLATIPALALLALPLWAQEDSPQEAPPPGGAAKARVIPAAPPRAQIVQLEVAIIGVPKTEALALSERLKDPATVEETFRALAAKVQAGQAKLIGYPVVETRSGNRCVLESIEEIRYGTRFDHAGEERAPEPGAAPPANPAASGIPVIPTVFETRNAGITFEAEPTLSPDGKTVDIQFAVQHVQFLGWDTTADGKVLNPAPQPRFHTNKVSTSMNFPAGQRVLAGVFESGTDPEAMEFFILRASQRGGDAK